MRRRVWFDLHSWLGLTAGLLLFVICWSGTIAVFSHEIDWALNPDIRAASHHGKTPFSHAADVVGAAFPDWQILEVNAPRHPGFAMEVLIGQQAGVTHRVYVDPVTLTVLGDTSYFNVQRFFRSFHMALFEADYFHVLGIPIGYFIVLLFAFPLLISSLSPFVFYRRWWRGFFKLETQKGAKVFWSDVHKIAGLWGVWFAAVISITSFWYLAEWFIPYQDAIAVSGGSSAHALEMWKLLDIASSSFPELHPTSVQFYSADEGIIFIVGHDGTTLTRGRAHIALDMQSGQVLEVYHQAKSGITARLMETVDVLHFGTFGGLWSQILYFMFGLSLCGLMLSGTHLHVKRRARRDPQNVIRGPILAAYVFTVVVLMMASVAGFSEIRAYGLDGEWPSTAPSVVGFVVLWTLSTIVILSVWLKSVR